MDPFTKATLSRHLRSLYGAVEKGYEPVGNMIEKVKWPLWGAVAGAPVVGYQLDRLSEKRTPIPDKNVEINEQREESPVGPPLGANNKVAEAPEEEWMGAASFAVKMALSPLPSLAIKEAQLDQMKQQIMAAKERAKRMTGPSKPTTGFLDGEQQSLESGDQIAPVSNRPQYRA